MQWQRDPFAGGAITEAKTVGAVTKMQKQLFFFFADLYRARLFQVQGTLAF